MFVYIRYSKTLKLRYITMMLDDPSLGGAGPGLLNTSMKSEGGLSGKGDYGEEEAGAGERTFDPSEATVSSGEGQLALDIDSVKIMAETVSVGGLPEEAAREIADEVSYRVKMLVQNAAKLMHHGKRAKLTCEDVDQALRMTGQEPLYGFQAGEHIPFRFTSGGGRDLHFMEDKELGNDHQSIIIVTKCVQFFRFIRAGVRHSAQDPGGCQSPVPLARH